MPRSQGGSGSRACNGEELQNNTHTQSKQRVQLSVLDYDLLWIIVHIFAVGGSLLGALGGVAGLGGDEGVPLGVVTKAGGHRDEDSEDELERGRGGAGKPHPATDKSSSQR